MVVSGRLDPTNDIITGCRGGTFGEVLFILKNQNGHYHF